MDFVDVATTTFAAREFTDDPVPDEVLYRIFDTARFAPNGGNRQGWKVIVIRDTDTKRSLGELCLGPMRVAAAQTRAGEVYWQSVTPSLINIAEAALDESLPIAIPMFEHLEDVPVVCIIAVDIAIPILFIPMSRPKILPFILSNCVFIFFKIVLSVVTSTYDISLKFFRSIFQILDEPSDLYKNSPSLHKPHPSLLLLLSLIHI